MSNFRKKKQNKTAFEEGNDIKYVMPRLIIFWKKHVADLCYFQEYLLYHELSSIFCPN